MRKHVTKLRLTRETLTVLENGNLGEVAGMATARFCPLTVTTFGCITGQVCHTCLGCT
jgi:hypothetical protein